MSQQQSTSGADATVSVSSSKKPLQKKPITYQDNEDEVQEFASDLNVIRVLAMIGHVFVLLKRRLVLLIHCKEIPSCNL